MVQTLYWHHRPPGPESAAEARKGGATPVMTVIVILVRTAPTAS
jgi:hypothetical protein